MSSFRIKFAQDEDLPSLATIAIHSYVSNALTMTYWMAKGAMREDLISWRLQSLKHDLPNNPTLSYRVLIDEESNQIVAFAIWQKPRRGASGEEKSAHTDANEQHKEQNPLPEGMNVELYGSFMEALWKERKESEISMSIERRILVSFSSDCT